MVDLGIKKPRKNWYAVKSNNQHQSTNQRANHLSIYLSMFVCKFVYINSLSLSLSLH